MAARDKEAQKDWQPVEPLTLEDGDGTSFMVPKREGLTLVVFFRGSWCFLSRRALAALRTVHRELGPPEGSVVALALEPMEKLGPLQRRLKLDFPLLSVEHPRFVESYPVGVETKQRSFRPVVLLIDGEGIIRYRYAGKGPRDWPDWRELLARLR